MKQPAYFLGHGSPMNAIEKNPFTERIARIPSELPEPPRAILMISAHWHTRKTFVSAAVRPETIHDFGGFPRALHEMQYPAPGAPQLAERVIALAPEIQRDASYGLDHGAWSLLVHMFPKADIPVAQLSIDYDQPPHYHIELGRRLASLRDEGNLIVASGNVVHNLRMFFSSQTREAPWAHRFNEFVKSRLLARDVAAIENFTSEGEDATLSVPTIDHFSPIFYILGMLAPEDKIEIIYDEVPGPMSMLSFCVG